MKLEGEGDSISNV